MIEEYTKTQLLDSFFNLGGNHNSESIVKMQEKFIKYINTHGYDRQISDVLIVSTMYVEEAKFNNFKKSHKIVLPIITRAINSIHEFDLYDIRILATVLGHAKDYNQSCLLGEKLLKSLEKYSDDINYPRIKAAIHTNIATMLLRSNYYDIITSYEDLKNEFLKHIDIAIELCEKENFNDFIGTNIVRKGLFLGDFNIVDKGLDFAKNINDKIYSILLDEVNEYSSHIQFSITEPQLRSRIIKNIKRYRKYRDMSIEMLANKSGISLSFLVYIENGKRFPSIYNLFKIAKVLDISVDTILNDEGE